MPPAIAKTKAVRLQPATAPVAATDISVYCPDLDRWPRSWMGLEKDLPPGEQLLACLRPFRQYDITVYSYDTGATRVCGKVCSQPQEFITGSSP